MIGKSGFQFREASPISGSTSGPSRYCAILALAATAVLASCGSGGDLPSQSGTAAVAPPPTPAPDTTPPTQPTAATAVPAGSSAIDLSWASSTDNIGVTGYRVERCRGVACSAFSEIATPTTTTLSDAGLDAAMSYSYRIRARDAAGNLGAYSQEVSATTDAPPPVLTDTTPPSQPAGLAAIADGPFGISLSWQASTDVVGVASYRVERCQGASCGDFAQIAAPTSNAFSDSGLTGATTYRYRVRAADAAGNLSTYSIAATGTTSDPPPPLPGTLPAWVSSLTPGQWFEIPNTQMSSIAPPPAPIGPPGSNGAESKIFAWTSFVVDTRFSTVYSVANGGHGNYAGNEVDRLELENDPPRWVQRLAPTPNNQIVDSVTHYNDGRPTSRHSYYGVTLNTANDQIMIFGGSRYGNGFGHSKLDSYNITLNTYSPANTHPDIPSSITRELAFAATSDPATGDIYAFGNFSVAKWTRGANSWNTSSGIGSAPSGYESMSAMDSIRKRILILGGNNADHHLYSPVTNTFSLVTLAGPSSGSVMARQGALIFVESIDRFLVKLRGAGGAVFQIHPETFEVTQFSTINGAPIPPILFDIGPYNKFLYVPRLRGAVYTPTHSGNSWFLRIH